LERVVLTAEDEELLAQIKRDQIKLDQINLEKGTLTETGQASSLQKGKS
jgi:hypothetical protein